MNLRLRSFRVRIALLSTLISAAVLLGFAFWTWEAIRRSNLERIDETLFEFGQRRLQMPLGRMPWNELSPSMELLLGEPREGAIVLLALGRDGRILYASENWPKGIPADAFPTPDQAGLPPPPATAQFRRRPGRPHEPSRGRMGRGPGLPPPMTVHLLDPFSRRGDGREWRFAVMASPSATLAIGLDLARHHSEMARLQWTLAVALLAGLGLIAAGGWWLAQRALRPVRALTRTAEGITAEGLDRRIVAADEDAEFDRLIEVFNAMLDRLERSFQQATRFSADAAHELKTPLTILQGELEQAVQRAAPGSDTQQTLGRLLEEVQRLKAITRKLLLLSLADSGSLRPHVEPVRVSEIVEAIAEDLEILAPGKSIEKDIAPRLWVRADPDLLRQVVQNLTNNAMKYSEPEGRIRIELRRDEWGVRLTVGNSGPGIPPGDRDRIFERFYRADKARNRRVDGVGLGLSLAREIARAHGGDLVLAEAREGWTAFALKLPAHEPAPTPAVPPQ